LKKIKIGTQGDAPAIWQANYTKFSLEEKGVDAELASFQTPGEVKAALLRGDVDMAVDALSDLPTTQPDGLVVAGVSFREDPADCLLIRHGEAAAQLFSLKNGAVVHASTARRKAQLLGYRPDVQFLDSADEVPTLLDRLRSGDFDGLILANAYLARLTLELDGVEKINLNVREFVPAPAQGVLAYRCCSDDLETRRLIQQHLHEPNTSAVTNVERKVLKQIGDEKPLGVYCERDSSGNYHVWAALADALNKPVRRIRLSQSTNFGLAEKVVEGLG
jgi:hydroxymethylbilane synthase